MLDVDRIRKDFPILNTSVHGKPLIYLDNAATTQLPKQVLDKINEQYHFFNANVHRGIHYLSEKSTARVENAREKTRSFINAQHSHEIIFTKGTTDSINLIARSFGESFVKEEDEILVSQMEHHSNLVPWQSLCKRTGAKLKIIPFDDNGDLDLKAYEANLSDKTKLVAITWVSNVLGTVNPISEIIATAHRADVPVLVDGAQAVRHNIVDVQALDFDFFCFSGHKIMGPTGIGILYGKEKWLDRLTPIEFGGAMVDQVDLYETTYGKLPFKFEAGTPNYVGAIGLCIALEYITDLGVAEIAMHEDMLLTECEKALSQLEEVNILGNPKRRAGTICFTINGAHTYDIAMLLDKLGIAVRSGTHCAQPLLRHYGLESTVRISPAFYNTNFEIEELQQAITRIIKVMGKRGL